MGTRLPVAISVAVFRGKLVCLFAECFLHPRRMKVRNLKSNILGRFLRWPKSVTAISISSRQFQLRSRQFQFHHGNFNFVHGNFNLTTAISTSFTAISISPRQFQFHHGNFNFTTAISISPRQFQLRSRQFQLHHGNFNFIFSRLTFPFPYLVLRVFMAI